jgi:DNA gyrase subunit A
MLITTGGVLIRTRVSEIREMGRVTQGVTLIDLDEGEKLAGLERIVDKDDDAADVPLDDDPSDGAVDGEGAPEDPAP